MSSDVVVVRRASAGRTFLTLLAGLVLGAVLAVAILASGLVSFGEGADAADTADDVADTADGTPDPTAGTAEPTASASGDVPPSCLAAAEHNATVSTALDEVAVGVRDQDALAVERALDAIADIKPDMDAASQECRDLAGATP